MDAIKELTVEEQIAEDLPVLPVLILQGFVPIDKKAVVQIVNRYLHITQNLQPPHEIITIAQAMQDLQDMEQMYMLNCGGGDVAFVLPILL